jgi:hypothetical protein
VALRVSDFVVRNVDYNYTKSKLLPKILGCVLDRNSAEVRRTALVCLYTILDLLDR